MNICVKNTFVNIVLIHRTHDVLRMFCIYGSKYKQTVKLWLSKNIGDEKKMALLHDVCSTHFWTDNYFLIRLECWDPHLCRRLLPFYINPFRSASLLFQPQCVLLSF